MFHSPLSIEGAATVSQLYGDYTNVGVLLRGIMVFSQRVRVSHIYIHIS